MYKCAVESAYAMGSVCYPPGPMESKRRRLHWESRCTALMEKMCTGQRSQGTLACATIRAHAFLDGSFNNWEC
eukprot:1160006-Pelagomonas_calceolata.AAC.13